MKEKSVRMKYGCSEDLFSNGKWDLLALCPDRDVGPMTSIWELTEIAGFFIRQYNESLDLLSFLI